MTPDVGTGYVLWRLARLLHAEAVAGPVPFDADRCRDTANGGTSWSAGSGSRAMCCGCNATRGPMRRRGMRKGETTDE